MTQWNDPKAGTTLTSSQASSYLLGPDDLVSLFVPELEEFTNKVFRVDAQGELSLPLIGRVHVGGRSLKEVEQDLKQKLSGILKNPDVVVTVTEFHSQPVSILGAVNNPGIHQLEGHKNLFEVLALAGGLRPDSGDTITIMRDLKWGSIPLPDARLDPTSHVSIASVKAKAAMNGMAPAGNISIMPGDTITVSKADLVYAVGSVNKSGGFALGENETISTLEVIALAEGLQKTAAPTKARVLRSVPGSAQRIEISLDIKALMSGKAADFLLRSNDILFIPNSGAKAFSQRTLDAVVNIATGVAIYGRY